MEVEILETILVHPSPSPPFLSSHGCLPLSHLDNDSNLNVTVRTLRLYAPNSSLSSTDSALLIAQALSKALSHYYPLSGALVRRPTDGRLEVRCAKESMGVPLTRASSLRTLASLDDTDPCVDRLAPDVGPAEALAHPLALQVTRFACGGFALGMCVHHAMCDGAGATLFLGAVAKLARGAGALTVEPLWDRAGLLGPRRPPRVEVPFHEVLKLDRDVVSGGVYQMEDGIVRERFHVSETRMDRLRTSLLEESGTSFTTFEALCALLWRARIKAMGVPDDKKVKLVYSMSIKKLLKPALPIRYWGNGCVPVYVQLSARELVEQPVSETANLIKKSKQRVTDEYVRSYIDFQELHHSEGVTAGKWLSAFTDWRHLGHSEVDFGWGGPVSVLPLSWKLLGSTEPCFFLPYASGDERKKDGFKLLVSLHESAMPAFRTGMEMFGNLD